MSVNAADVQSERLASRDDQDNRFGRRPVRNTVVATLSLLVILFGTLFVALPAQTGVAFAVTQTQVSGTGSVVYGKVVDGHNAPVAGARVKLIRWVNGSRHVLFAVRTDKRGVYRFAVHHPQVTNYRVRVAKSVGGRWLVGVRIIQMRRGTAFRVIAKLSKSRGFFFLPVSTY